jgi:dolichol-phosphate mannosyltransferase
MRSPVISVVLPTYDEEEGIVAALEAVTAVLKGIDDAFEIVVVNDGSTDGTAACVERAIAAEPRIRMVEFSRNFGHQPAITAGLQAVRGEYVAVMDADLQDPPDVLPRLLEQARGGGYDVVYGVRAKRRATPFKKLSYWFYYRLLRLFSEHPAPLDAGDFCIMSARVVKEINRLPERGRYVRGLRGWVGFRQTGVEYERPSRSSGDTKYSLAKLIRLASTGMLSSSRVPLMLSTFAGALLAFGGFAWAGWIVFARLVHGNAPTGFAATMVAVLLIGGAQLLAIGVVGQYVGRVLDQVEARPHYVIARRVNFDGAESGPDTP